MNGRRLFREYAQSRGREAIGFIEIKEEREYYGDFIRTILVTTDSKGKLEETEIDYKDVINWIIRWKQLS